MIFHADMIEAILAGRKTRTTRPVTPCQISTEYYEPCFYKIEHTYPIQPGRGQKAVGHIRVTKVSSFDGGISGIRRCNQLGHARREGFEDWEAFVVYWNALYAKADAKRIGAVWVIDFKLVKELMDND